MDTEFTAEDAALGLWQSGTNDDVWRAIFEGGAGVEDQVEFVGELLRLIRGSEIFEVGDLTKDEVIASIVRRYPYLA